MGDKTAARRAAVECGVSVVPGTNQALDSPDQAKEFAHEFGYPVILKAAMGGGGRGMRVVRNGAYWDCGDNLECLRSWAECNTCHVRVTVEAVLQLRQESHARGMPCWLSTAHQGCGWP